MRKINQAKVRLPRRVLTSYHIHSKLLGRVLVSKAWQHFIINFCYPKMASKLAYSGLVSWVAEWVFFEDFSYEREVWCLVRLQMQELLDLVSIFYSKALNISQSIPNLWLYVVLKPLTKQLTKPNKPRTRHRASASASGK